MKKIIVFFFAFFLGLYAVLAQKKNVVITPLIGTRIFDDKSLGNGLGRAQRGKVMTALTVGVEVNSPIYPLTLSFQRDYWASLYPFNAVDTMYASLASLFSESRRTDHILLYWKKGRNTFGIGHSWRTIDNIGSHLGEFSTQKYRGVELSFSRSFSWVDIELRRRINYAPGFGLLDRSLSSLHIIYRISKRTDSRTSSQKDAPIKVSGMLGTRFFRPKGIETIRGERLDFIGVAPMVGLEFLWKKHNLSFNVDKDFWVGINAGSLTRNLKGYISNVSLGLRHHNLLKNSKYLRYGLSATFIDDFQNNREKRGLNRIGKKLRYIDFGIGANVSYEVYKNCDLEAKHTFTLVDDDSPFTLRRLSLGVLFRFSPGS